jgi:hypothetical protein
MLTSVTGSPAAAPSLHKTQLKAMIANRCTKRILATDPAG